MALRMLQLIVPASVTDVSAALAEDQRVMHCSSVAAEDGTLQISVLVTGADAEAVMDQLQARYGAYGGFRMVLLAVEATVPAAAGDETATNGAAAARQISRAELYEDIAQASQLSLPYVLMVVLSTVVAAIGLIRGDVAIIIGAMVIAPLLGPNMALALAATLGDLALAQRSLRVIAAGVACAGGLSLLLGAVLYIDPAAPEIIARTQPGGGDIVLALAAGAAGTLAFTSGVPAVVVGVMVAVALLPPTVVAGLLLGSGQYGSATGALVLLLTNVTCVNLAAVATFFLLGVAPSQWWQAPRARRHTMRAVTVWLGLLLLLLALIIAGEIAPV